MFVLLECVDFCDIVCLNLDDVWFGEIEEKELGVCGYMFWNEIKLMQEFGFVDIQCYIMIYVKYVKFLKFVGYYYGGYKGLYFILNVNLFMCFYYMVDVDFEFCLFLGIFLFEEMLLVVIKCYFINFDYV